MSNGQSKGRQQRRRRQERPRHGSKDEKRAGATYTRDQARAQHAYAMVEKFRKEHDEKLFKKYKSLVNGFGASVMRSGLVAALAFVARNQDKTEVKAFAKHLGKAKIPGLQGEKIAELISAARTLPLDDYMLATREVLRVSIWFRRAVQAAYAEDKAKKRGES